MAVDEFCPAPLKCPCCSFAGNVAEKKTNVYFRKIPDCFESARKHLLHFSIYGFWISVWLPTPFTIASFSWWALVFFYYPKFQLMGPGIILLSQESADGPWYSFTIASFSWWALVFFYDHKNQLRALVFFSALQLYASQPTHIQYLWIKVKKQFYIWAILHLSNFTSEQFDDFTF